MITTSATSNSIWDRLFGHQLEFNRFAVISVVLLIVGCLGGAAVGLGAIDSSFQLLTIAMTSMACLSLLLAVQPVRWILNMAALCVAIDVVFILYNLLIA